MGIYKEGRPFKYDPSNNKGKRPPRKAGEYRIRGKNGDILYIGETVDLNRRMGEHKRKGKLTEGRTFEYKIADGRASSSTRRKHERMKIKQHDPLLNKSAGGEGRIAKK